MLRNIYLHGHLKKLFGSKHRFAVETAVEALRALHCAFPQQFLETIKGGTFEVVRGDKRNGMRMDLDLAGSFKLGNADLHFIPVLMGARTGRGKGTGKVILGAALVGAAIFASGGTLAAPLASMGTAVPGLGAIGVTWGSIASIGLGVMLTGAAQLATKPDEAKQDSKHDASHTFNGPTNTGEQGAAIQLIYGRNVMVGSVCVSFDADIEDIGAYRA